MRGADNLIQPERKQDTVCLSERFNQAELWQKEMRLAARDFYGSSGESHVYDSRGSAINPFHS